MKLVPNDAARRADHGNISFIS